MWNEVISNPLYVTVALVLCIVLLMFWILRLEIKMRRVLRGKDARSLEDTIIEAHKNLDKLNEFQKEAISYFTNIEKRLLRSVQAVETIRFNPFKGNGDGGNQSFTTAFLTEKGNGVVISSLYSRDRVSVFSKPLLNFGSQFELTHEEKEVLTKSQNNLK